MRPLSAALALALAAIPAHPALGQDRIPKVEYQAGHAGMEKKVKGSLVISDAELQFLDEKGNTRLTIPMASITGVSSSIDRKEASLGAKLALGFFAKSRKEELVTVAYEVAETAEGVIFKTQKNMSAGAVAKIQFHLKKAGIAAAPDSTAATIVPHAPAVVEAAMPPAQ
jgi:hypothetical protein